MLRLASFVSGPCRISLLRRIGLREKRIQQIFVLAPQRIRYLLNGGRYGREDHRGQRARVGVATTAVEHQRQARDDHTGQRALFQWRKHRHRG